MLPLVGRMNNENADTGSKEGSNRNDDVKQGHFAGLSDRRVASQ